MIPFREEKIKNAVACFAAGFFKRRGYSPRQTWIYKFLALLDFRMLRKTGTPSLGLEYDAMQYGPVPVRLYDQRFDLRTDKFRFVRTVDGGSRVEPCGEPDLDFFSDDELSEIDKILSVYAAEDANLERLIDDAHKEIRAWNTAWEVARKVGRGRMPMEYADEFENLSKGNPTPEEERFLCYRDMVALESVESAS